MIRKKVLFYSLFIILVSFTISFSSEKSREELFLKIGIQPIKGDSKAPNFYLEDLKGKKSELNNFKGKVIFINFWATWCGPCKEEMPSMEILFQQFKEKDFVFLSISVDYEGRKPVKEFIEKKRYTFPVLLDPKCDVLDLYEVKRIPTTIIIDKNRKVIGRATGPINWKSPEVISLLNILLGK